MTNNQILIIDERGPIELNWLPGELMTGFEKASLGFMRLLEESRIPRQQQRDIVNYINNNFFAKFTNNSK